MSSQRDLFDHGETEPLYPVEAGHVRGSDTSEAAARSINSGTSPEQTSWAFQHLVRNRHPEGGFAGLGTSPWRRIRCRPSRPFGSGTGTAESSASV